MTLQLLFALLVPAMLLVGLTYLVSKGRLRFSPGAVFLLAQRREIWMAGIIALVTAGAIKALFG